MKSSFSSNLKFIHTTAFIAAIILSIFCFRWQGVEAAKFSTIAKGRVFSSTIDSIRGAIYSSDGSTLAYSEPRFDMFVWMDDLVFLEKTEVQTRAEFINKISPILKLSTAEIEKTINTNYEKNIRWIPLAKNLTHSQWEDLINLKTDKGNIDLRGMSFQYTSERIYPEQNLASHVIGLSNKEDNKFVGVSGLELYWSDLLNPIKGLTIQEKDARGGAITAALLPTIEPKSGSSIYTAINKNIQRIIERELKKGVEQFMAKSGTAVLVDPKTGQVMALANYPDYNPNNRNEKDSSVFGNIAVTAPYEMGSTGKALTVSAAIELGVITPDTIMPSHNGCEKIHEELAPLCTWDKMPQPEMTVRDCFAKSDNICFYRISEKLNKEDFYKYLDNFGVGKPSGIDLKEESVGYLRESDLWTLGDVSAFSYGHGYQLNAIQATMAYSVLANKGVRMKPYIVTSISNPQEEEKIYKPQAVVRVLEEKNTAIINEMMEYNYGLSIRPWEWYYSHLRDYKIGTKTGTALIVGSDGNYTNEINSTQIGYDLSDKRTFVLFVRLEKPQGSDIERLSSNNVRIVWLEMFNAIKELIGVPRK